MPFIVTFNNCSLKLDLSHDDDDRAPGPKGDSMRAVSCSERESHLVSPLLALIIK